MEKSYLDRLLNDEEIKKERDDFFREDDSSFLGVFLFYILAAGFVIGFCLLLGGYPDPNAESLYDRFYRECFEDKHTKTECDFMYNQMYR